MNSFIAIAALAAAMTFCNLSDKLQSGGPSDQRPQASNQSSGPSKPAFDRDAIKTELTNLANDLTDAAAKGEITFVAQNTTDDFELTGVDGKVQNKDKALADIKVEKSVRSWALTDIELVSADEESAVLRYIVNVTLKRGQSGRARTTDNYVKRNGRWLLKSEQQTMIK